MSRQAWRRSAPPGPAFEENLSELAEVAESEPLVCLIDDVQGLDRASAQVLAFLPRRLLAEQIAMVFAVR